MSMQLGLLLDPGFGEIEAVLPSPEEIEAIDAARTTGGGFTRARLAEWGIPWPPPRGWKVRLEREARIAQAVASGMVPADKTSGATVPLERRTARRKPGRAPRKKPTSLREREEVS